MRFIMIVIAVFILAGPPNTAQAQVSVGISFNLGIQPAWGPVGYDYVENYYMPEIDVYYNVPHRRYYYREGGVWIGRASLPGRYGSFDRYNAHKVVINDRDPWRRHNTYRGKYQSYGKQHDQTPIRDSKDSKYFANRYHPQHNNWVREQNQEKQKRAIRDNGNRGNAGNSRNMKSNGNNGNSGKQGNNGKGNGNGNGGKQNGRGGGKGRR
jgi:hypothetical protein